MSRVWLENTVRSINLQQGHFSCSNAYLPILCVLLSNKLFLKLLTFFLLFIPFFGLIARSRQSHDVYHSFTKQLLGPFNSENLSALSVRFFSKRLPKKISTYDESAKSFETVQIISLLWCQRQVSLVNLPCDISQGLFFFTALRFPGNEPWIWSNGMHCSLE